MAVTDVAGAAVGGVALVALGTAVEGAAVVVTMAVALMTADFVGVAATGEATAVAGTAVEVEAACAVGTAVALATAEPAGAMVAEVVTTELAGVSCPADATGCAVGVGCPTGICTVDGSPAAPHAVARPATAMRSTSSWYGLIFPPVATFTVNMTLVPLSSVVTTLLCHDRAAAYQKLLAPSHDGEVDIRAFVGLDGVDIEG